MSGHRRYSPDNDNNNRRRNNIVHREDIRNYDIYKLSANANGNPLLVLPGLTPVPTPTQSPPAIRKPSPTIRRNTTDVGMYDSQFLPPNIVTDVSFCKPNGARMYCKPVSFFGTPIDKEEIEAKRTSKMMKHTADTLLDSSTDSETEYFYTRILGHSSGPQPPSTMHDRYMMMRDEQEKKEKEKRRATRRRLRKEAQLKKDQTTGSSSSSKKQDALLEKLISQPNLIKSIKEENLGGYTSECDTVVPDNYYPNNSDSDIEILSRSQEGR